MKRFICLLSLVTALAASSVSAQPAVLDAADELASSGRCAAALSLLGHAQGTASELAGRRGLCHAQLGQAEEAARAIALALADAADPWVTANRARLLDALGGSSPPAAPIPTAAPASVTPTPVEPTPTSAGPANPARIGEPFLRAFAFAPPADVPVPRHGSERPRPRLVLRAALSLGAYSAAKKPMLFGGGDVESGEISNPPDRQDVRMIEWRDPGSTIGPTGARLSVGLEAELRLTASIALSGTFSLALFPGAIDDTRVNVYTVSGPSWGGNYDRGLGVGFSTDLVLRVASSSTFAFGGFGARVGVVRFPGSIVVTDPSFEVDLRYAGSGASLGGIVEGGFYLGSRRDHALSLRAVLGRPRLGVEFAYAIPFWSAGR